MITFDLQVIPLNSPIKLLALQLRPDKDHLLLTVIELLLMANYVCSMLFLQSQANNKRFTVSMQAWGFTSGFTIILAKHSQSVTCCL